MTTIEKTEREERRGGPRSTDALADYLFLVLECTRPQASGMRIDLSRISEIEVGRGSARSVLRERIPGGQRLVLRVPDRHMSTTHCRFARTAEGFRLDDAGSTNGTILNGEAVTHALIPDGACIEIGRTLFRWRERLITPGVGPCDMDGEPSVDSGDLTQGTLLPSGAADLTVLSRIAGSRLPILLLGETGTGKEVLARLLHAASQRSGPMVAVNCGAIPRDLAPSALFGHRRGAFSGATTDAPGFFRAADKGTLLLDEIGDLPVDSQVTLLRVLQESEVVPVGDTRPIPIDVWVIAATHASLAQRVTRNEFRADLYSRLAGHTHRLPALRDRREDLGLLIARIAADLPQAKDLQLSADAGRALFKYAWPGNVRELQHALVRAATLGCGGAVGLAHLPEALAACASPDGAWPACDPNTTPLLPEDRALLKRLETALMAHNGNVTRVADAMGKQRMQIQRWMKRFGLDAARFRES